MATTSTIRPGPRNKPLRGATGSVPHGRTIRQGLAVICVPTRGRPAFRPGRTRALVALAGLAFAASPAGAQASPPPWGAALLAGYPGLVSEVTAHDVILRDGTRFPIAPSPPLAATGDDPPARNIADMFAERYPAGSIAPPAPGADPGRARFEPFFDHVYGDCRTGAVATKLRAVAWMPGLGRQRVMVTTVNGVADHLEAVVRDLAALPPMLRRQLVPSAGTYACRAIAGTARRSMHSYGVAIDIAVRASDYWRWAGGEGARWRNRIDPRIVAIFERHGFIWGGRWSHFDTMHFEYRPELLPPGRDNDAIVARVRVALPAIHDAACGSTPGDLTESLSPTRALMVTPCA